MTKLADYMTLDPIHRATDFTAPPLLRDALTRVGLDPEKDRPLIATPADRKKSVIDARADGRCRLCDQLVWMSPSSWRSQDIWTCIVCLECLEKAIGHGALRPVTVPCPRCLVEFKNYRSLGQHQRAARRTHAMGHADRVCPDRRTVEETRAAQLQRVRLLGKLGLMGRHP